MNKKARAHIEWVRSSAGITILIMMLAGIIFYIFVIPPYEREAILNGLDDDPIILLDISPGEISGVTQEYGRDSVSLSDVMVDNSRHTLQEVVSNQFVLTSDMFQNTIADFTFDADKETLQSATFQFYIYSKEGDGVLKVKLNGYEIFSSKLGVGNKAIVNLPLDKIMPGINKVELYIVPGVSTKRYTIIDARFISEDYAPEQSVVTQTFTMPDIAGNRDIQLKAYIIQQGEARNIKVTLNKNVIFDAVPSTNFLVELASKQINEGSNTIEWEVTKDGKYQVRFVRVSYDTLELEGKQKTYYFDIGRNNWDRINSNNYVCQLYVERNSGIDEFSVTINGDVHKYNFGNSNEFKTDICDELTRGLNEIKISAEEKIDLAELKVSIR